MEQTLIDANPVQMDLSIDEITSSNPDEMDTSSDEIASLNPIPIDLSITEVEPSLGEMDLSLSIDQPKMEIDTEIDELISKIKEESILSIIEKSKILFEKNKSCENYNNVLKVLNKALRNRGYFDDDKIYCFQSFHINKFNIIKENEKKAHIIFLMKDTVHRQAACLSIPEGIHYAPKLETELLQIKQFMEDNIEYI